MKWLLLALAGPTAAAALINFLRAPGWLWGWKTAIATTEFGHWLVLLPAGLALLAVGLTAGPWRILILGLCLLAIAGLLRPAFGAWQIGRTMGEGAFSWTRLFWPPATQSVAPDVFAYSRSSGEALTLDFYAPTGNLPAEGAPCMVVIHGGGWDSGDSSQLAAWNRRWAARGWAVAAINYRLAPRHPWPAPREDVRAALEWLKARAGSLRLDPHRFVLLGRSAGGQIATAVAYGVADPAVRGVVALYAPHDMPFAWSVSREDDTLNSINLLRQYLGGPPDEPARQALYHSASGHLLAAPGGPPALLIHGYPDTLVWHRHSRRLAARLAELGVPCTHWELPWATHAFDFNPDGPGGQLADHAIARFMAAVTR